MTDANKISKSITLMLNKYEFPTLPQQTRNAVQTLIEKGWKFYATEQRRGWCNMQEKIITIPLWVFRPDHKQSGKFCWYVVHECAHAFNYINGTYKGGDNHGQAFMAELLPICPTEFVHHELGYKPRNAKAAGISPKLLDDKEI